MKEQIDKIVNEITDFINSPYSTDLFDKRDILIKIIDCVTKDIYNAINTINDGKINNINFNVVDNTKQFLTFLQYVYFEIPINEKFYNFVKNFTLLLNNWNNNFDKNSDIEILIKRVSLTYDQWYTIETLLHHAKNLLFILKDKGNISYNFIPELSKHYLKSFCDKEDNKDGNNC